MPYYNVAQRQTAVFEVGGERRGILCDKEAWKWPSLTDLFVLLRWSGRWDPFF